MLCSVLLFCGFFFFFKQKTAYEMRISDWSSDVCSSDLCTRLRHRPRVGHGALRPDLPQYRVGPRRGIGLAVAPAHRRHARSEEHTSELQSLMRISYAVFCLKKKQNKQKSKIP